MGEHMYFDYIKERLGQESKEFDNGFITYSINGDNCSIHELYVKPQARKSGLGSSMVEAVEDEAKINGCKKLWATVIVESNNATEALEFHIKMGGKVVSAHNGVIVTSKGI
jgi:GNAT superfamily N-acetyltransferase